jgi:hypothetical protein
MSESRRLPRLGYAETKSQSCIITTPQFHLVEDYIAGLCKMYRRDYMRSLQTNVQSKNLFVCLFDPIRLFTVTV